MVRARYARVRALRAAEKRRQRWAVRSIRMVWMQFQARKTLAYAKARVDEKMAPYRRKRAELMRAAAETEGAEAADDSKDGLGCGQLSPAAAVAGEAGAHAAAAGIAAAGAAAISAAPVAVARVAGQASGRLGNVLLDTIAASRRRQEEEAAARAAENAKARADFDAIFAACEAEMAAEEEAEALERAALEQEVLLKAFKVLRKQHDEARQKKEARMAEIRPRLRLPPSRKHAAVSKEGLVPHRRQGQLQLKSQREFDVWAVMGQLKGLSLPLGAAPVWEGTGVPRLAEEYAAACGFSAAFGPLLFEHAVAKVLGKEAFSSRESGELPAEQVAYVFGKFWEDEIAPFDPSERFFRLVGNSDRGGIVKVGCWVRYIPRASNHFYFDITFYYRVYA